TMFSFKMEYRWIINRTGTLPDGHTPDLTITHLPERGREISDLLKLDLYHKTVIKNHKNVMRITFV
ncbi:hypothetical protein, partial [Salmonella enterica]|uniref:hypothetical protein n=1 Tax=Salmonella enterica TaxID=28901 RepID=UPI001961FC68